MKNGVPGQVGNGCEKHVLINFKTNKRQVIEVRYASIFSDARDPTKIAKDEILFRAPNAIPCFSFGIPVQVAND